MTLQVYAARVWWEARAPRERLLLAFLLIAITLWLAVVAIWQPLQASRARLADQIAHYERSLTVLQSQPTAGTSVIAPDDRPLNVVITETAAASQLTIRRLEPDGSRIRVVLDEAPFDAIILWLEAIQRDQDLKPSEIELTRRPAPGVVNAILTLER